MKILFVCWANVGRSQMAAALYNNLTGAQDADSAGTEVDVPGENLLEHYKRVSGMYILGVMDSIGIDVREAKRTQLKASMLNKYDHIINMAEKEHTPRWLQHSEKYEYWHVKDPGGKDYETALQALNTIKVKVEKLIEREL
ncbi:MAG: low molecular weight phosphatase family protein [Candidatus Saccharimonadales bacterium]